MSEQQLTPTMEDYLEAIYNISQERRVVRVKNIAEKIGVKMPTVSNMLKNLSQRGFIDYEKHEFLELTKKGHKIGREIERRHHIIRSFLTDILKIDSETANEEACKMEHGMSMETLERLTQFIDFIYTCPKAGSEWLESFKEFRANGINPDKCLKRLKGSEKDLMGQLKGLKNEDETEHDTQLC